MPEYVHTAVSRTINKWNLVELIINISLADEVVMLSRPVLNNKYEVVRLGKIFYKEWQTNHVMDTITILLDRDNLGDADKGISSSSAIENDLSMDKDRRGPRMRSNNGHCSC